MTTQQHLIECVNQVFHDYEIALQNATTEEEALEWEAHIDALEDYIEILRNKCNVEEATKGALA